MEHLYLINYLKNGKPCSYQIPAESEANALVRLGQIHGDNVERRDDVEINVISVKKTSLV